MENGLFKLFFYAREKSNDSPGASAAPPGLGTIACIGKRIIDQLSGTQWQMKRKLQYGPNNGTCNFCKCKQNKMIELTDSTQHCQFHRKYPIKDPELELKE